MIYATCIRAIAVVTTAVFLPACCSPTIVAPTAELDELPLGPFAAVGDTQRTSLAERICGRERDDPAQARLLSCLADENPAFLVHLGDLIFNAASEKQWRFFDRLLLPLTSRKTLILPVLGNHDYYGPRRKREAQLVARFPWLEGVTWSSRRPGPLGLLFLDSNLGKHSCGRRAEQRAFLLSEVARLDAAPDICGILAFAHHPPYTNSRVTGDETEVGEELIPYLRASRKVLAFVSGHAHGYERFQEQGMAFIVSGGGGGPRVRLLEGARRRHDDLFKGASPRPWNYLIVTPERGAVRVTVKGITSRDAELLVLEEFRLPYPTGGPLP